MQDVLTRLAQVLEERKEADPASSYVARLYAEGLDTILKKVDAVTPQAIARVARDLLKQETFTTVIIRPS